MAHSNCVTQSVFTLPASSQPSLLTEPFTSVQLNPHADVHGVVRDGHEAHEAGDDWRLEVLEHDIVGIPVSFNHLRLTHTHTS